MTTKMRSLRNFRNPIGCLILLAALGAAAGCSESPSGSGTNMNHVLPSGASVAGWLVTPSGGSHASTATLDYIANGGSSGCTECHGSDLSGGISRVSCFGNTANCHHSPVANWATPAGHGATAKKAPGSSGFASCQICHGNNFSGGGSQVACADCHGVPAPHPAAPWSGPTFTHTTTNTANATVCAQCHFPGSPNNPAGHPATPAPAGTAPGCFNSTLCHGEAGTPHPLNGLWFAFPPEPQVHGNAAKATPSAATGFAYCQVCHGSGTDFAGGSSGISCYTTCHFVSAQQPVTPPYPPHPVAPWRASAGSTYTHTNTDPGNAAVCAYCHRSAAGTPGCFNSTLCHGSGGVAHAVPFNDPAHYAVDNAAFATSCGTCHAISAPSVGPACQTCHVAGNPVAAPPLASCTSCHASPPDNNAPAGAAYPNLAGAHAKHLALAILPGGTNVVTCDTCHTGLGPSLLNLNHYNNAKTRLPPGDVAFPAGFLYTGITGTAVTFDNALACSNVSCHGALGTPNWRTGATTCTSCHNSAAAPPAFYTDFTQAFFTHNTHNNRTGCTTCHTALPAGTHFGTLGDKAIPSRAAAATINPAFGYPSPPPAFPSESNCNTNSVGGCH